MISDTLAEAISEIEAYQTSMPGVYEGMRGEIEATLVAMTRLMVRLDSPPGEEPERWLEMMTRVARNDPGDQRERMRDRIYVVKRDMMGAAASHPRPRCCRRAWNRPLTARPMDPPSWRRVHLTLGTTPRVKAIGTGGSVVRDHKETQG